MIKKVKKEYTRGVNSLIILGAWMIWKHRNACVFEGVPPSVNSIMRDIKDEHSLWCLAIAKKLQDLGLIDVIKAARSRFWSCSYLFHRLAFDLFNLPHIFGPCM